MAKKQEPEMMEGLDCEIEALRSLIAKAAALPTNDLTLNDLISLLNSVGSNSLHLARTLKIRSELEKDQNDPGKMLRQALRELEAEWPEYKELTQQFPPYQEEQPK
jgi:hypothetical protein